MISHYYSIALTLPVFTSRHNKSTGIHFVGRTTKPNETQTGYCLYQDDSQFHNPLFKHNKKSGRTNQRRDASKHNEKTKAPM